MNRKLILNMVFIFKIKLEFMKKRKRLKSMLRKKREWINQNYLKFTILKYEKLAFVV